MKITDYVYLSQIYPSDHNSTNFPSTPSTPVGSPQGIAGMSQATFFLNPDNTVLVIWPVHITSRNESPNKLVLLYMECQWESHDKRKADIRTALSCCGVCKLMPRLQMSFPFPQTHPWSALSCSLFGTACQILMYSLFDSCWHSVP